MRAFAIVSERHAEGAFCSLSSNPVQLVVATTFMTNIYDQNVQIITNNIGVFVIIGVFV